MKIDRLLGIMIYLLNRETVSARALSEKFEVSPRTIQRDIETLSYAGIPVTASHGANGGYSIINSFIMDKQVFNTEDYVFLLTALKGLCSAYENKQVEATFEKLLTLSPDDLNLQQNICLDLSVLREGFNLRNYLDSIDTAIRKKMIIEFEYTNSDNFKSQRYVEPVLLTHKWYSWYLFGYCCEKHDYRIFRLSRIRNLILTDKLFTNIHKNAVEILEQRSDNRQYINIKLLCSSDIRISIEENFPNSHITEIENSNIIIEFKVPDNEKGWFGTILGYGNKLTVIEPEDLKTKLIKHAREILDKYC